MGTTLSYLHVEGYQDPDVVDVDCGQVYGTTCLYINDLDNEYMFFEKEYQPQKYIVQTGYIEPLSFSSYVPNHSHGFDEYIETTHRSGYITVTGTPNVNDTITVNSIVFTFKSSIVNATDIEIGSATYITARNIMNTICSYSLNNSWVILAEAYNNVCYLITIASPGTSYAISKSSSAITLSGSTMSQNRVKITLLNPELNEYSSMSYYIGYRHIDASISANGYSYSFYFLYDTNILYYSKRQHGGIQSTGVKQLSSITGLDTYVIPSINTDGVYVAVVRLLSNYDHCITMYNVDQQLGDPISTTGTIEYIWTPPSSYLGRIVICHGEPYAMYVDNTVDDSIIMIQRLSPTGEISDDPYVLFDNANTITELCVRDNLSYGLRDTYGVKTTYDNTQTPIMCNDIDGNINNSYNVLYLYPTLPMVT